MTWDLRGRLTFFADGQPMRLLTDRIFFSNLLTVRVSAVDAAPTWRKAGWLNQIVEVDGVSNNIESSTKMLLLGDKIVRFPTKIGEFYYLSFSPVYWLRGEVDVIFWEWIGDDILDGDLSQIKRALNIL